MIDYRKIDADLKRFNEFAIYCKGKHYIALFIIWPVFNKKKHQCFNDLFESGIPFLQSFNIAKSL